MLNIYLSRQGDSQKYKDFLSKIEEHDTARNFKILKNCGADYKRQKLIISSHCDHKLLTSLQHCESGSFIQDTVHSAGKYIEKAMDETSDLYLVLTTKTAYEQNIIVMLIEFLKARNYSIGLIEIFTTVMQELITNAVIHGNLGLDLCLKDIMDPANFKPDQAEKLQEAFLKIQTLLDNPDYGQKPIMLRINCFPETIILDIQDKGAGFNFEEFQKKYSDTKLVKGMDLVFLMSEDMQYNKETKTTSLILKDPDKKALKVLDLHSKEICLGIYTADKARFKTMKKTLGKAGFKKINQLSARETTQHKMLDEINLLLMLSDITPKEMFEKVTKIRQGATRIDLPILCQKSENITLAQLKKLSTNTNDFLSSSIHSHELVSRVKAHLSMQQAKKNFEEFYAHYQSEIMQSKKTIEHFERRTSIFLRDLEHKKEFCILLNGSQTAVENMENTDLLQEKMRIPYGNGFSFHRCGHDYFIFISMRNGLSSVLIMSYLKGYIEHLKKGDEPLPPAEIIQQVQGFIEEILPISIKINIFCTCWEHENQAFQYAKQGNFSILKYDHSKNILCGDNQKSIKDTDMIKDKQILYIVDSSIHIDKKQLQSVSCRIFKEKIQNLWAIENSDINLYNAQNIKIPTLMILPYEKKEKEK